MKALIDISEALSKTLTEICQRENISRAELIRRAISQFVSEKKPEVIRSAFGILKNRKIDGLAYQKKIRSEW